MAYVVHLLTQPDWLLWLWRSVVWVSAAYLLGLGALIFIRPSVVHRFFEGFATSWRINFLEALVRLTIGLAFMAVSPEMKVSVVAFWFGAILAATAIPLMFLYDLHTSQRAWVLPLTRRILPLMGVIAISAGALIVWALI